MKELLKELIQADSTAQKGEAAVAEVLAQWFRGHGVDCRIDRWDARRANVIAHIKSTGVRPALLFVCHLDVVGPGEEPWGFPPFSAAEVDGKIFGRGATDMKGGLAAAAAAICAIVDSGMELQGDIVLAATAGEETDSAGVQRFMRDRDGLPPLAGVVVPEPTDFAVVTAHRGLFWLKVTTKGKAVHSSMPERGVNAIGLMRHVLNELERYQIPFGPHPLLGKSSLSINVISGGEAMNMVPDRCELGLDIRTLPGQDCDDLRYDFERMLGRLKAKVPQFESELVTERIAGALETDPQCEFVRTFCSAVNVDLTNVINFTTDAPHLVPLGVPIVIYGPGQPPLCHQVDEYLDIEDLQAGVDRFQDVIRAFLT
jgi:succinyl-diaminopimelate desuccinylase